MIMKKLVIVAILFFTALYEPLTAQVKKVVVLNPQVVRYNSNGTVRVHQDNGKHKGWYKQKRHKKRVIVPGTVVTHRTHVITPRRNGHGKKH
jgi:RES domain-containing protein